MAETNAQLEAAIQSLVTAVSTFATAHVAIRASLLNAFKGGHVFNLSKISGAATYKAMSASLVDLWDGSVYKFPNFIIYLQFRVNKVKLGETGASKIFLVDAKNIFTDYHTITDAQILAAYTARNDDRAKKNSSALFKCLDSSVVGDLKSTIFAYV